LTKFRCYFESKQVLGKGNFAKVFLVERKKDRKEFAVKVFDKETIMKDELERKCLLYEIKMMRAMRHPRVLAMHELYEGRPNSRRELYLLSLRALQRL
jgi:serine/threonine protein kinase